MSSNPYKHSSGDVVELRSCTVADLLATWNDIDDPLPFIDDEPAVDEYIF